MSVWINYVGLGLFLLAILHTFSVQHFEKLAQRSDSHAGLWHLMGEVEVVFGFWAIVLFISMALLQGLPSAVNYANTRNYIEPLFVFAIMTVAATRPILSMTVRLVLILGDAMPLTGKTGRYVVSLTVIPLLGSFITEPAAMTVAALILGRQFFSQAVSTSFKYATLGVLFVNISIGGTLTHFAAPPVLMVASTWGWDMAFMLEQFGHKTILAVFLNTLVLTAIFYRELALLKRDNGNSENEAAPIPPSVTLIHLLILGGIVFFAHYPPIFLALLLFFLGIAHAYPQHQDRLLLKEALLVGFFLAGLVVLGGLQQWWLQPLLKSMSVDSVFVSAIGLTALTDNAALTYLGSLVEGLSDQFKYALVAGAVTGGGLTIIANAPNPAGIALLRPYFINQVISPMRLLLAALAPTLVAALSFRFL